MQINLSIDLLLSTCGLMQINLLLIALDLCFNANLSIDLLLLTCDLVQINLSINLLLLTCGLNANLSLNGLVLCKVTFLLINCS